MADSIKADRILWINDRATRRIPQKDLLAGCSKTFRYKAAILVTSIHTPALRYGGVYERNLVKRQSSKIPLDPPLRKGETEHESSPL